MEEELKFYKRHLGYSYLFLTFLYWVGFICCWFVLDLGQPGWESTADQCEAWEVVFTLTARVFFFGAFSIVMMQAVPGYAMELIKDNPPKKDSTREEKLDEITKDLEKCIADLEHKLYKDIYEYIGDINVSIFK